MRFIRKRIIRPLIVLALIIAPLILFAKGGFSLTFSSSKEDYSNVIEDGVTNGDASIVDIAMLGAHDAFSHHITTTSQVDPGEPEGSLLRNATLGKIVDGVFVRLSRAQKGGAATLLKAGVRYFDVRLSYVDGVWWTKHGLLSDHLSTYLDELIPFLANHPAEFIIFDMQHVYFPDGTTYDDLFDYLGSYQVSGKSLLDFVHHDPLTEQLRDLTYDIVTNNQTSAGVVILAKTPSSVTLPYHYNRGNGDTAVINIRSLWHNTADTTTLLEGITSEHEYLNTTVIYQDILRVNQAQKTGVLSGSDLWDTIFGWSLLDLANSSNMALIEHADFEAWLVTMPIVMVDYANSTKGDFNNVVNEAFITYNQTL